MYIALRKEIKNRNNNNLLFVSFSKEEAENLSDFIDVIKSKGINYFLAIHSNDNIYNPIYAMLCNDNLFKAKSGLIILDDNTLFNQDYFNMVMYESGVILGQSKNLYVLNNNISKDGMEKYIKSPINIVQLTNKEKVIEAIDKSEYLPKNLFSDDEVNKYSKDRIFYISLLVMMDIKLGTVKKIQKRLNTILDEEISYKDALKSLEDSLSTGVTVLNFGKSEIFKSPGLWPYEKETEILEKDFPVRSAFNKIKVFKSDFNNAEGDTDIVATIKMEFIIPNNEVLGVSFKPFFQIEDNSIIPNDVIELLVSDGLNKESIKVMPHNDNYRIYYTMNCDNGSMNCDIIESLKNKYSQTCNFIYPK